MNTAPKNPSSTAARVRLGLVSVLCIVGLAAALRPYGGFSGGGNVKVPGLGQRTPTELALLTLRMASGLFALWLLASIIASVSSLLRAQSKARSNAPMGSVSEDLSSTKIRSGNPAFIGALPRLFGPGWLQQLLRQAAGGTVALALLAGPASAVTRSPQAGTARTVLAPVASVLATQDTTVQFAGDVTTGQRWPVLPETSETAGTSGTPATTTITTAITTPTTPIAAATPTTTPSAPNAASVSSSTTNTTSAPLVRAPSTSLPQTPSTKREPIRSEEVTLQNLSRSQTPTTATPRSFVGSPAVPPARTSAIPTTTPVAPTTTGSTATPTTVAGQPSSATAAVSPADRKSAMPVARTSLESVNRLDTAGQPANLEQPPAPTPGSPETSTPTVASWSSTETAAVHVVQPGESFWAIAERLMLAHDPKADDHEIARYWEALQTHNAHRLPAPGVPDLLFPGTELSLPPITG